MVTPRASSDQIMVRHPFGNHTSHNRLHLIQRVHFPHSLTAGELVHVPLEMFHAELVECALVGSFSGVQPRNSL